MKNEAINVEYQIVVAGYNNGYLTTELIKVNASNLDDAILKAEQKSFLDGATARI